MELLLAVFCALAIAGKPEIGNPGFEEVDQRTGMPTEWNLTYLPDGRTHVRYETKAIMRGDQPTNALSITVAADHPSRNVAYNVHQELKGLVSGKSYRVAASVQTRGLTTKPMVVVQCLDASGSKHVGFSRSPEQKLTRDLEQWECITTELTVPEGTSTVVLRIGIPSHGNAGGTAIIDDVSIVEAG